MPTADSKRETDYRTDGWTLLTLREFLLHKHDELRVLISEYDKRYEQRFQAEQLALKDALVAQEKAVTAALIAADRAVSKAETATEKRFESVNEFRSALADQAASLLSRVEYSVQYQSIVERLNKLEEAQNVMRGLRENAKDVGASHMWLIGLVVSVVAALVVVAIEVAWRK